MDINQSQDDRSTPLQIAAEKPQWSVLECLVGWGAALNLVNRHGNTPLHAVTMLRSPVTPDSPQLNEVDTIKCYTLMSCQNFYDCLLL